MTLLGFLKTFFAIFLLVMVPVNHSNGIIAIQ